MPYESTITFKAVMRTDKRSDGRNEGRDDRRPLGWYDNRKPDHHSKNAHPHSNRDRDQVRSEHVYHGYGDRLSRASREEAISALLGATKKALNFLSWLKDDFHQEIRGVQAYAGPEVINDLWIYKVDISNGYRRPRDQSSQRRDRQDQEPPKSEFNVVAKGLIQSLRSAIAATECSPNPIITRNLQHANNDMGELLRSVGSKFELLDRLLTELEMLSVFLQRNGAYAGSRGDSNNCSGSPHRQSRRRKGSQGRQRSQGGNDAYLYTNDSDRDDDPIDRRSRDGSEAGDHDQDQRDQQEIGHQEEPERDDNGRKGIVGHAMHCTRRHKTDLR